MTCPLDYGKAVANRIAGLGKKMLVTLNLLNTLNQPAYGLCSIAEEKENLNSNWDTQINHREHGEADLYCLSALPVICSVLMAGDRFNLRVRTTGRKSRAV